MSVWNVCVKSSIVMGIWLAAAGASEAGALGPPEQVLWATLASTPRDSAAGANGEHVELLDVGGTRVLRRRRSDGSLPAINVHILGNWGERIAVDRAGRVAVVGTIPGQVGIFLRVIDRAGADAVPQTRIDDNAGGSVSSPVVGSNADGNLAVTWQKYDSVSNASTIKLRAFTPTGLPQGTVATVSTSTGLLHQVTDVAVDRYAVASLVWMRPVSTTTLGVWIGRYSYLGAALGGERRLNSSGVHSLLPHVAVAPSGRAVAVWSELASTSSSAVIMGQRFDDAGGLLGGNFIVNDTTNNDTFCEVGMKDDGGFVAVWNNRGRGTNPIIPPAALGREYRSDGTAVAAAFKIATGSTAAVTGVSMDLAGGFVAMWSALDPTVGGVTLIRRYVSDALPPIVTLQDGVPVTGISSVAGLRRLYKFSNPEGTPALTFSIIGDGDADLIVRYAALPTATDFDFHPALTGSNEAIQILGPPAGDYYVEIATFLPFSNVTLQVSTQVEPGGGGGGGGCGGGPVQQ
jgi:Bacterial pre-peptidase C-terminal domain